MADLTRRPGQGRTTPDTPGQSENVRIVPFRSRGPMRPDRPDSPRRGFPPLGGNPGLSGLSCRLASAELVELARRIERLAPSHRDPEAFHLERDDIAKTLRRFAHG